MKTRMEDLWVLYLSAFTATLLACLASPPILAKNPEVLAVGPPAIHAGGGPQNIKTLIATQPLIPRGNSAFASIVQQTASNAVPKAVIMLSSQPGAAQSNPSLNGANAASSVSNSRTAGSGNAGNPVFTTSKGEVQLAAGKSVELADPGTPGLRVEVTAPENQALNLGKILADSGQKGIFAGLASRGDVPHAEHAVVTSDGRVLLRTTQNIVPMTGETAAAGGAVRNNAASSSGKNAEPMRVASASPLGATRGRAANDGNNAGNPHTTGASQSKAPAKADFQTDALLRSENSQGNSSHGGNSQEDGSRGQTSQGSGAHGSNSNGGSPQGNGEPFQRPATGTDADEAKRVDAEQKQSGGATVLESAERKGNVCG